MAKVTNKGAALNTTSGLASGAASGAAIGSLFAPGIGTAIGAAGGALIGGTAGFLAGRKNAERNVQSLRIGPGFEDAGYYTQDLSKDYSFQNKIIGGDPTTGAKIGQGMDAGLKVAGSLAGTVGGVSGTTPNITTPSITQPQGVDLKALLNEDVFMNQQNPTDNNEQNNIFKGPDLEIQSQDYWKNYLQKGKTSLTKNPYSTTV
jgi:hypothetical protein